MDCGHFVIDVFYGSTGIWRHCDDDNITQISDLPKGVYYIETHKNTKNIDIRINRCIIFLYIRTIHLTKHSSNFLQEFTTMSRITHMKKLIEDQYVFRRDLTIIQEVDYEIQTSISYIKDELQISIEKYISGMTRKEK